MSSALLLGLVPEGSALYVVIIATEILCPDKVGRQSALPMPDQPTTAPPMTGGLVDLRLQKALTLCAQARLAATT